LKKILTERSEFCAADGVEKFKRKLDEGKIQVAPVPLFRVSLRNARFRPIGPSDGS
jgi:hypothetical protein